MAKQTIALGTVADDGTGDTLRSGGDKINDNFDELYTADAANLKAADNLSDVADVGTAQENLGLVVLADQAAYDALTPDADTFYFIPEA